MNALNHILAKYGLFRRDFHINPIVIENMTKRLELARLFHELDYKVGVEVGVFQGGNLKTLCRENPQAFIYGVDAWAPYRDLGLTEDRETAESQEQKYLMSVARAQGFDNAELIREYSMDAVLQFSHNSIDFVYIDANHDYEYVIQDIAEWSKRVRPGGIISGHDSQLPGVKKATHEYTEAHNINPWFVMGSPIERSPSWFWVKE